MTVSILLEQPCDKSDSLHKLVVISLFQTCSNNLGQAVRTQLVENLGLLQFVRFT